MRILFFVLILTLSLPSYSQIENDTLFSTDTSIKLNSKIITSEFKTQTPSIGIIGTIKSDKDSTGNIASDTSKRSLTQNIPTIDLKQKTGTAKSTLLTNKDSLVSKNTEKLKSLKPKSIGFVKKQVKTLKPMGSISVGYEYGVLPFVVGNNYPIGGYKTEGDISFLLMGIPLELVYSYTNIKNVIGLNNYFRISYDADRYKDQLSQKLSIKDKLLLGQLGTLQLQQQQLAQKIQYLNFLKQTPNYKPSFNDSLKTNYSLNINLPDSSSIPNYSGKYGDSLNYSLGSYNKVDSADYLRKKDSIMNVIKKYKTQYDSVNNEINGIKKEIDQISGYQNNPHTFTNPYLSKAQQLLSNIKKLEIGLCHPTYSTFLVNNVPLQGINVEYMKNNNFLAFTYGTTINNLLFNMNTVQGQVQGVRNMYNYFDFGNIEAGRKILSLKGGVGAKDDSHLYVGFLLGKGRTNYMQLNPIDNNSSSYTKESNLVLELDAKYKLSEQLSVDVIVGKSSVQEEDLSMQQIKKSVNEIFSDYRSYAVLTRINSGIKKTKTKLTFTTRWIDPYFKSFGIGFLRSDNLRYEVKAEQPITSKIKYTVAYRREEDNLLKLYDYKNTLQSINNSLNLKLNRQFNLRLIYAPLFRELKSSSYIIKDRNNISTVIVSYTPKPKRVTSQFNALYSRYIISGDSSNINFENIAYTHQFLFKSGFKTDMNVSWFKNNLSDTIGNDTYLAMMDIGYSAKNNNSFTVGGKAAYKKGIDPQFGFVVKATVKLYKSLFWDTEMEKIIIGDYYNSFILEKINKFPYYCSTRLVLNF